ncbi:MAG: hypothetical protein ACI92G_002978 [Candidatus Pelagisphaera sp.]|jgi:hypothetical protein
MEKGTNDYELRDLEYPSIPQIRAYARCYRLVLATGVTLLRNLRLKLYPLQTLIAMKANTSEEISAIGIAAILSQ